MNPGGIDIEIVAPPDAPVVDVILKEMAWYWPGALFLDADGDDPIALDDPEVFIRAPSSREFFILRDRAALESWDRLGAVPENENTMLQFLIRDHGTGQRQFRLVTLVCDVRAEWIDDLVPELRHNFRDTPLLLPLVKPPHLPRVA
jgi:hypothetical protein